MREAHDDDVAYITRLFTLPHARDVFNPPNAHMVRAAQEDPNAKSFILERDGEPAGHFLIDDREWLFEFRVLIAEVPGRGAGRFALAWGIEHAFRECGAHRIYLEIRESNARITHLAESAGFRREGLFPDGFFDARTGRYENLVPFGLLDANGADRALASQRDGRAALVRTGR